MDELLRHKLQIILEGGFVWSSLLQHLKIKHESIGLSKDLVIFKWILLYGFKIFNENIVFGYFKFFITIARLKGSHLI